MGPVVSELQWNKIQDLIQKGIDEGATLVVGGLAVSVVRRHVVHLNDRDSLLPMLRSGRAPGVLERRFEVDPRLGPAAVALGAIALDERSHLLLEDLLSVGPERRLVSAPAGLRSAGHDQGQGQGKTQSSGGLRNVLDDTI